MKTSKLVLSLALAASLFLFLFSTGETGIFDFWWLMSASVLVLCCAALRFDTSFFTRLADDLKEHVFEKCLLGFASAAVLYLVFLCGNYLSALIYPDAASYIENVYALRRNASLVRIILLIALVIAPGEEIFWRGFVQQALEKRIKIHAAVVSTALLYTAVHLASLNPMLLAAALVCGLFWGSLYAWKHSLLANIVSHIVWDLLVFAIIPFR